MWICGKVRGFGPGYESRLNLPVYRYIVGVITCFHAGYYRIGNRSAIWGREIIAVWRMGVIWPAAKIFGLYSDGPILAW